MQQAEKHEKRYRVRKDARSHRGRLFDATHREGDRILGNLTSGRRSQLYFMAHELEEI